MEQDLSQQAYGWATPVPKPTDPLIFRYHHHHHLNNNTTTRLSSMTELVRATSGSPRLVWTGPKPPPSSLLVEGEVVLWGPPPASGEAELLRVHHGRVIERLPKDMRRRKRRRHRDQIYFAT